MSYPKKVRSFIAISHFYSNFLSFLNRLGKAIISGLWLGFTSDEDLNQATAYFYNEVDTRSQDTAWCLDAGLFEWERDILFKYFKGLKTILVLSAGSGREVVAMGQMGYKVDAFECNQKLIEKGNEILAVGSKIQHVAEDTFPVVDQAYDGIVIGWGGYMHIPGRERRIQLLKDAYQKIVKYGPVLLSFYTHDRNSRMYKFSFFLAKLVGRIIFRKRKIEEGDFLGKFYYHSFTEQEVKEELEAAGFELLEFQAKPYGHAVARAL